MKVETFTMNGKPFIEISAGHDTFFISGQDLSDALTQIGIDLCEEKIGRTYTQYKVSATIVIETARQLLEQSLK